MHRPGYLGVYQTQSHTPGESIWQGAMLHSSVRSLHVLRHDISLLGETLACYLRPAEAGPGHVIRRLLLRPLHQNQQNRQDFQRRERRRGGGQAALHQPVFSGEPPRSPPPHRHTRTDKETQVKPSSSALLQVFICLSLISVQLVMVSVWLLLEVPGTRRFTLPERRQTVILKCNVRDSSMLLSLGYDVFLVILCTVYVSLLLHASLVTALSRARFLHVRYNIYINVCPLYSCSELTCSY